MSEYEPGEMKYCPKYLCSNCKNGELEINKMVSLYDEIVYEFICDNCEAVFEAIKK